MQTLFFVSHTHWDREWYEPFQLFRIRLVHCIDRLLDILESEPEYKHFMLDGQTIVLEDYFEVRPEREQTLRDHVISGRLAIGPWYVLPDEFLVSGEAIIRNLQRGMRFADQFSRTRGSDKPLRESSGTAEGSHTGSGAMRIGYLPDPFGHISQMPQILRGFGMGTAAFRRGLADEATEMWWEAPDGTRVLACYLRDGYDNAAWIEHSADGFNAGIQKIRDSLTPHAITSNLLLMNGTDHMEPWSDLPRLLSAARAQFADARIIHASLPMYVEAAEREIVQRKVELGLVRGELRNPKRHHLLPGVASTRIWIKQRNAHAEMLLEKWAEPFTAYTALSAEGKSGIGNTFLQSPTAKAQLLQLAWKYLLENHPHDSICGCGSDQTHMDMGPRFDWCEQVAEQIISASLDEITASIDTHHATQTPAIIVFNPTAAPRTGAVGATIEVPGSLDDFLVVDDSGVTVSYQILSRRVDEYYRADVDAKSLRTLLAMAEEGRLLGMALQDAFINGDESPMRIDVTLSSQGEPNAQIMTEGLAQIQQLIAHDANSAFDVRAHSPTKFEIEFVARDVPGYGYKTLHLISGKADRPAEAVRTSFLLENEFFRIEPNREDGTITIFDKITGAVYEKANHFVDGGDRGDLYNFNPPENDNLIALPNAKPHIEIQQSTARQSLQLVMSYQLPAKLADDRSARASEMVEEQIVTTVSLNPGVRRVEFRTRVDNRARDHRLRVEFPSPIVTDYANADQAFDVVRRSFVMPKETSHWIEQPRPEAPMQSFVAISDDTIGLALVTRGLPEYEAYPTYSRSGEVSRRTGTTLALTLLRCTGWLSRNDLSQRSGHAGPALETPGAQEIGQHIFEYALIPFPGDWHHALAPAHAFVAPMRAVASDAHTGALPPSGSFVDVTPHEFVLSAIKPAEYGEALVVRGYNIAEVSIEVTLEVWRDYARATRIKLNEEPVAEIALQHGRRVYLTVRPKEIVTIRFDPAS